MTPDHLDLRGAGSTALLFASGWLGAFHVWDAVLGRLANFTTAACVPAGLPAAAPADGGWWFEGGRAELDRAGEWFPPSRLVVVGFSVSGSIALDAAAGCDLRGVTGIGGAGRGVEE